METESDWQSHYVKLSDNNCSEKKINIFKDNNPMQFERYAGLTHCDIFWLLFSWFRSSSAYESAEQQPKYFSKCQLWRYVIICPTATTLEVELVGGREVRGDDG